MRSKGPNWECSDRDDSLTRSREIIPWEEWQAMYIEEAKDAENRTCTFEAEGLESRANL